MLKIEPAAQRRMLESLARWRRLLQVGVDFAAWTVAGLAAVVIRYEFDVTWSLVADGVSFGMIAGTTHIIVGRLTGLYVRRWHYGSIEEIPALATTTGLTVLAMASGNALVFDRPVPFSVPFLAAGIAVAVMGASRLSWRLLLGRSLRPDHERLRRTVIFGAGTAGSQLAEQLLSDPNSPLLPVAFLDDDPAKARLRRFGVPVLGTRDRLAAVAEQVDADTIVVAVPSAGSDLMRELSESALGTGLDVRVLPPIAELLDGIRVGDVRELSEEDLLGRHVVETDVASIAGYVAGKRILVTGAGGSIGAELCLQLKRFEPAELVMLDRDESALHALELKLHGTAMLDDPALVVADIRDRERLDEVFATHRPEVVFHAAALKHLPLLELHPGEAWKTNVVGTMNVLEAAAATGVERFVNISTDKAADPTSVLGYTKRIAERLTAGVAAETAGTYLSVRFGNVLGSRGSVLTAFREQIQAGGPVTVTDPDVTRYFMTAGEAVELVIQAGAVGRDGEALVLDMGEPVRIDAVARRLVEQADEPVEIQYLGLRPGEKLHEVLWGADEEDRRPVHPLIGHVDVPPLSFDEVADYQDSPEHLRVLSVAHSEEMGEAATAILP